MRSIAGQHLVHLLVNLLARQHGVVKHVMLRVIHAQLHAGVILSPRIDGGTLEEGLVQLGVAVGAGSTTTHRANETAPTVVVYVGPGLDPRSFSLPGIAVTGYGWHSNASTVASLPEFSNSSTNPLGPYLAACIAAGFVFKAAYGRWNVVDAKHDMWRLGSDPEPELDTIQIPPTYVVGLGAVGAAFAYSLAASQGLTGRLIGIDPQDMSETDSNRLLSGTTETIGVSKADLFSRLFQGGITAYPYRGRWPADYLGDPGRHTAPEVWREEEALRFQWVISCVDRDRDRVGIANALPRHILSGSTLGMAAQTAYYSVAGDCECLACRHRTPQQLGVEEIAHKLRAVDVNGRERWYDAHGASDRERASIEEYLSDPRCSGPGEADLARLGIQGEVDWAVGFVSAAAGVLIAARLLRAVRRGVSTEIASGSEWRYLFWVDELLLSQARRAIDCHVCGSLKDAWLSLWKASMP